MSKKFLLISFFILISAAISFAADTNANYTNYGNSSPFQLSLGEASRILSKDVEDYVHSLYGYGDTDFFYQLRDITGASRTSKVAGPQWFATVYENYSKRFTTATNNTAATNNYNTTRKRATTRGTYRRTMGGEVDNIPFSVIGDLLDGFNFVFAEEPEPYQAWLNRGIIDSSDYDVFPDPLETLCVITTNGRATLNVKFANPFARHFPFWWNWKPTTLADRGYWWQNNYDWRETGFYTVEPIAYIYDTTDSEILARNSDGFYEKIYDVITSYDVVSNDRTNYRLYVADTAGKILYRSSGDISGTNYKICSGDKLITSSSGQVLYDSDKVMCIVSGDAVYDASGNLSYTTERALTTGGILDSRYIYLCGVRNISEIITIDGLDEYNYSVRVTPITEREIASNNYLNATVNILSDSENYGSSLGYITFKQRASFMPGYTNFREVSPIPFVVANVSDGNAADNPLIFDMTVFNPDNNEPVKRIKFAWDAQTPLEQDLGTFFTMARLNMTTSTLYNLETKITNRTGTRYELYRYDRVTPSTGSYVSILPKCWKYDLTPDVYGTLPKSFLLDAHSQIAPGVVTVYNENIGPGYGNIDMASDTSASFRLYEYESANPKSLRLNYKRVAGMQTFTDPVRRIDPFSVSLAADDAVVQSDDLVTVQSFTMHFTDVINNEDQTVKEIEALTGKTPVVPYLDPNEGIVDNYLQPFEIYINSGALNSFAISQDITDSDSDPRVLARRVSYDIIPIYGETITNESGDVTSPDLLGYEYSTDSSNNMAVQPFAVRMKIPRESQLLSKIWDELDSAENSKALFDTFAKSATVFVRSSAAAEYDADLFKAVTNKGGLLGVTAQDCVNAFIYEDYLYLDFMVFMADAVSKNTNKTAFVEIFKDDDVPYILIGDGNVDKRFNLTFYVSSPRTDAGNSTVSEGKNTTLSGSSSSGGGCDFIRSNALFLLLAVYGVKSMLSKRMRRQ